MLTTFDDIRNDFIRKMGIATTTAYYTDAIIGGWARQSTRFASSYKKWPFSEGRISTTFTTGGGVNQDEWNFEGVKADSIRILTIGGKRHQKLNFQDYLIFREEEPDSNDRVFTDFGRLVFINPNTDASGTLVAYAQYQPVDIDITDNDATTVFSNGDEEGNEAIVEEMIAYANTREKKENEANFHHTRATQILDALWEKTNDEQFNYHTHRSRGGMWERIDVVHGDLKDELFKRNQF